MKLSSSKIAHILFAGFEQQANAGAFKSSSEAYQAALLADGTGSR